MYSNVLYYYLYRTFRNEVILAFAIVASFWLRAHAALGGYVICEFATVVAPKIKYKNRIV